MTTPNPGKQPQIPQGFDADTYIQYLRNTNLGHVADKLERELRKASPTELRELSAKVGGDVAKTLGSTTTEDWLARLITGDKTMLDLKHKVRRLVSIQDPVLIQGETGTGKELIARALHGHRQGKFVAVNCTSLPSELIESELFGHVRGAFTGALVDRKGKFREALGGTIFLDEIGDMPLDMQSKLLRVLQEGIVVPIGSETEYDVKSVRVVSATNVGINDLTTTTAFREDLLYRLCVFLLQTTPLRARLDDVKLILEKLAPRLKEKLDPIYYARKFRGNVREVLADIRRWEVLDELPYE